ncbi:uncharacterized protein PFL1_03500 [Pseudozyma flocculosa PF-1]|uniref:Uncharacterized protein n=1 Tax=Pseudozyma flocculosa PF-1 TaxID=1277687 RepID=A0A061H999_9BASI|nr:uncharacterized protein PFL1_03500 [Pseudozyma flocculosa PF-1]EPQ29213.1 hypothetical protein PFL1_03500 [Pseudozyma flocculosa PF-1]
MAVAVHAAVDGEIGQQLPFIVRRQHNPEELEETSPRPHAEPEFPPTPARASGMRRGDTIYTGSRRRYDLNTLLESPHRSDNLAQSVVVRHRLDLYRAYRKALAESLGLSEDGSLSPRVTPAVYNGYMRDVPERLARAESLSELMQLPFDDPLLKHVVESVPDARRIWATKGVPVLAAAINRARVQPTVWYPDLSDEGTVAATGAQTTDRSILRRQQRILEEMLGHLRL